MERERANECRAISVLCTIVACFLALLVLGMGCATTTAPQRWRAGRNLAHFYDEHAIYVTVDTPVKLGEHVREGTKFDILVTTDRPAWLRIYSSTEEGTILSTTTPGPVTTFRWTAMATTLSGRAMTERIVVLAS
ncbi:hypothetical protein HY480_02855 [Candidatus Uhrbacteria bacterium]|nr:hypothetical protein [Candidatus Uhrbacteria bacterium]